MDEGRLEDVARALLREPPGGFVAARTAAAKERRPDDRTLATAIGRIRKPAVAAWVVDLLAADGALTDAVALGPALRKAQASADVDAIGQLRSQRRELLEAIAQRGADLARAAGVDVTPPVLDAVQGTIEAAMADARAGRAVESGLLLRPLESVGFEPVDLEGALAVPDAVDLGAPVVELGGQRKARGSRRGGARTAAAPGASRKRGRAPAAEPESEPDAELEPESEPAVAPEPAPEPEPASAPDPAALRRAESEARTASRAADDALDAADAAIDAYDDRDRALRERREALAAELADVEQRLRVGEAERGDLERRRDEAEQAADDARAALADARRRRRSARG